jgi:uncharacterized protein YwgA
MGRNEVKWLIRLLNVKPEKLAEPASFNERLKVQKAVFLLKYLKVEPFSNYGFSLYLHGPYSPELAKDYYDLTKVRPKSVSLNPETLSRLKRFVSKDDRWLEVASSILSLKGRYSTVASDEVYSTLKMSKPWVDKSMYESVTKDLVESQLLPP